MPSARRASRHDANGGNADEGLPAASSRRCSGADRPRPRIAGRVADHPERLRSPFTQLEMLGMWTYSDGARTVKGYWRPGGSAGAGSGAGAGAGSWVLVDQGTGNVQGAVPAG